MADKIYGMEPRREGQEGPLVPGPQCLRGLIIEEF